MWPCELRALMLITGLGGVAEPPIIVFGYVRGQVNYGNIRFSCVDECLQWADIVEKVPNRGSPKSPPIRGLSECCRSIPSQFRYAPHTLLNRKFGGSPKSIFSIGLYGPQKIRRCRKPTFSTISANSGHHCATSFRGDRPDQGKHFRSVLHRSRVEFPSPFRPAQNAVSKAS